MFRHDNREKYIGTSNSLKHLKAGDIFKTQSGESFTVLCADIVHKSHLGIVCINDQPAPFAYIITSNYPFGRRNNATPLRYAIYAELTP